MLGPVDRAVDGDGDRAGGEIDGDVADALDETDLLDDGALAVPAGHAADGDGRAADERAGGAVQHGGVSRFGVLRTPPSLSAAPVRSRRRDRRDP